VTSASSTRPACATTRASIPRTTSKPPPWPSSPTDRRAPASTCSTTRPIPSAKTALSGTWNQPSRTYDRLAQHIASSGATAVYLALDGVDPNAGALIRALRTRLGPQIELLTNWTALPVGPLFHLAGSAAHGVIIATSEVPNGPLDPAGRQFITRFAATQHHAPVNPSAMYAAQATEVMLEAISHSNGTRQSVTRALLATCVQNGILGSFCFDTNGDPTTTPVTILQVNQPGASGPELDTSGTDVIGVIHATRSSIR
jgi:ABC-type branched-subunit amino acid transport system substrate-binding protein